VKDLVKLYSDLESNLKPSYFDLWSRLAGFADSDRELSPTALQQPHFLTDQVQAKPFLRIQPDRFELLCGGETPRIFRTASPPRGAVPLLLNYNFFIHVNTPFIIEVSTAFLLKSVS
jgi:hypothetical protein